ncbi:Cytochrome c oxidase subunit 5A [Borealophlyctis nickersoniae]|nr:Cytochrome c oxidase subunit 5A [Borealophlyctis nickersoniae]
MNVATRRLATTAVRSPTAAPRRFLSSSNMPPITLQQIETRWPRLPEAERGAIADVLHEAQKGDWKKMSMEQKRAAYYIAYGAYGPRTGPNPASKYKIATWTTIFVSAAITGSILWKKYVIPDLPTMTKEWKEAEAQIALERRVDPFSKEYKEYAKKQEALKKAAAQPATE